MEEQKVYPEKNITQSSNNVAWKVIVFAVTLTFIFLFGVTFIPGGEGLGLLFLPLAPIFVFMPIFLVVYFPILAISLYRQKRNRDLFDILTFCLIIIFLITWLLINK